MALKSFTSKIFFLLLGGVLTFIIAQYQSDIKNSTKLLDTTITKTNLLTGKIGTDHEMMVLINGDTMDRYGKVTFQVYNFTGQNYENVPFSIELYNPDGTEVEVVADEFFSIEGVTEIFEEIPNSEPSLFDGSFKKGYNISVLNSSVESYSPQLTFNYYIKGKIPDMLQINVLKVGLDEHELDWSRVNKQLWTGSP